MEDKEYTGQSIRKKRGPQSMFSYKDEEAKILAKAMEEGLGLRHATFRVNNYRILKGLEIVGMSCPHNLFQKLKPKFSTVGKMKQGSNDPKSPWARARLRWVKQLIIMFRAYDKLEDLDLDPNNLEDCFNPEKLAEVKIDQVAWWDEHHIECIIAGLGGNNIQISFPTDEEGNLDPVNGKIRSLQRKKLNVKYKKQGRFSLGVATVCVKGEREGRRGLLFHIQSKRLSQLKLGTN